MNDPRSCSCCCWRLSLTNKWHWLGCQVGMNETKKTTLFLSLIPKKANSVKMQISNYSINKMTCQIMYLVTLYHFYTKSQVKSSHSKFLANKSQVPKIATQSDWSLVLWLESPISEHIAHTHIITMTSRNCLRFTFALHSDTANMNKAVTVVAGLTRVNIKYFIESEIHSHKWNFFLFF